MRKNKIFDPYKIRPEDYRSRYPELKRIKEFEGLTATELIFIWHYANPTSDLIGIENDMERVTEALKLANYTPAKKIKEDIFNLRFPEKLALGIDRMSKFEPDARMQARIMVEEILKNYSNLCKIEDYEDDEGKLDRKKYVDTTTTIAKELPALIAKLEEGFGVSVQSDDETEQGISFSRDWYQSQQ